NRSLRSVAIWSTSSSLGMSRISLALIRSSVLAQHELGPEGKLVRGQADRLASQRLGHPGELEHHAAGLDHGDPALGGALARAHAGLGRLLGHRLVRED